MSPQQIIKAQARAALKGNYVKAAFAFIIALLPIYIIEGAEAVIIYGISEFIANEKTAGIITNIAVYAVVILITVFLSPIANGFIRMFYNNGLFGKAQLSDLFYYFEKGKYKQALSLNLSFALRMLLPSALAFLPLISFIVIAMTIGGDFMSGVLYLDVYFVLTVLSSIIAVLYSLRYFTVFTIRVENENIPNNELFKLSKDIMMYQTGSAVRLVFSYTPWMLLCLTVLPMLYVVPYMTQGLCIGAKWMTRAAYERR